ncbi:MAG TPA: hypothetical protein VK553_09410 [Candidatus Nitrosopolaris rasttigaisensis]|jgi:hypothetical protein|nr:hypothetical protein [Candidatus Nitrosopolaris rasttigaisensis]
MAALNDTKRIVRSSRADFEVYILTMKADRQFFYLYGLHHLCFVGRGVGRRRTKVEAFNPAFAYHFDLEVIDH